MITKSYIVQHRGPVGITDVVGLIVVHFHDTKGLGDLLRIALLRNPLTIIVHVIARETSRSGTTVPRDGGQSSGRTSRLCTVGHQRQDQALQPINPILHII